MFLLYHIPLVGREDGTEGVTKMIQRIKMTKKLIM